MHRITPHNHPNVLSLLFVGQFSTVVEEGRETGKGKKKVSRKRVIPFWTDDSIAKSWAGCGRIVKTDSAGKKDYRTIISSI